MQIKLTKNIPKSTSYDKICVQLLILGNLNHLEMTGIDVIIWRTS